MGSFTTKLKLGGPAYGVDSSLRRLACLLAGHKYRISRVMNPGARKVTCERCRGVWGMHDNTQSFVPWDADLEAAYAPGGPLDPASDPRFHGLPAYPEGDVVGACWREPRKPNV